MQDANKPHNTHTAYAYKRLGKKHGRLMECGTGRIDQDRNIVHVFMDRTPIGGWTGYVMLSPHNVRPPPQPDDKTEDEEQDGDN